MDKKLLKLLTTYLNSCYVLDMKEQEYLSLSNELNRISMVSCYDKMLDAKDALLKQMVDEGFDEIGILHFTQSTITALEDLLKN